MGMIRRADLEQLTRDALVMDLDDMRSRGEAIISEATAHAQRVIADANAERERLIATAHEAGFASGHAEGLAAGRAEGAESGASEARDAESEAIATLVSGWSEALDTFESRREQVLREARTDVVRLAVEIAARVVRRCVDIDPRAVESQIEAVLGSIARPTRLTLRVHPDDLGAAERALPGLLDRFEQCRHADVVADATLGRGSAVATTEGGGRIDAAIARQLDRMIAEILPDDPGLWGDQGSADPATDPRSDAA